MRRIPLHPSLSLLFRARFDHFSPFIPLLSLFPPACAPLLVINLAGSIPEGYLALIYELRVVPPAV